jgi:glycine betaine/proline transport system permease protein
VLILAIFLDRLTAALAEQPDRGLWNRLRRTRRQAAATPAGDPAAADDVAPAGSGEPAPGSTTRRRVRGALRPG